MTEAQETLLHDSRLSDPARILGLYISLLPEGPNELPHDSLSTLLHGTPNPDTVGRHLRKLATHGYVKRTSLGGSGSPRYEWCAREISRGEARVPVKFHGESPTVVEGGGVRDTPFNSPEPLDVKALRAIEQAGDRLSGCRGALRDYLQSRVPQDHQYAYVQAVVSWIDNPLTTFRQPDGSAVPASERTKMLAVALNEMAATDEGGRKYKTGDPINLRNKLSAVIRSTFESVRQKATGTDGGKRYTGKRDLPPDAQEYTTRPYQGLKT